MKLIITLHGEPFNVHELRCTTPAGLTIVKDNADL